MKQETTTPVITSASGREKSERIPPLFAGGINDLQYIGERDFSNILALYVEVAAACPYTIEENGDINPDRMPPAHRVARKQADNMLDAAVVILVAQSTLAALYTAGAIGDGGEP